MIKNYLLPSILLCSIIFTSISNAQVLSNPLLIEQSSTVLGSGIATDLKPKAHLELYQEARKSSLAVSMARSQGRTIILDQDYTVYPSDSNTPTRVKRKVVLNQSVHYGESADTECAVKILQEGSFDTSGRWLGTNLTHHLEIPHCPIDRKIIEAKQELKPAGLADVRSPIQLEQINIHLAPKKKPAVSTQMPFHPAPIIIPEVKKDCAKERKEKVAAIYSSDVALKSLESELQSLQNQNPNKQVTAEDSAILANAAKEIEKYPELSASLNQIIVDVYKTRKCPTNNVKGWNEFKNVSMSLYQGKEHEKIDMINILSKEKNPAFWCGYNDSDKTWYFGTQIAKNENHIESTDQFNTTALSVREDNQIFVFEKSTIDDDKSYRVGGDLGDSMLFKIAPGVYLDGVAFTKNKEDMQEFGFYSNNLVFTEELFSQPSAPVISIIPVQSNLILELTQKIESRKQELDRSVPPCEENKIAVLIPAHLPSPTPTPIPTPAPTPVTAVNDLIVEIPSITPTTDDEVIPKPQMSTEQIEDLFNPNRPIMFEVVWNKDTLGDPKKFRSGGNERSKVFDELKSKKLFALMFADLYQVNRQALDQEASAHLKEGQQLTVKIYFQRYDTGMDQFGIPGSYTEKECIKGLFRNGDLKVNWDLIEKNGYKLKTFCAPLVTIKMELTENGTAIKSIPLRDENRLPYGPGLSTKLLSSQDVLNGINEIFKD